MDTQVKKLKKLLGLLLAAILCLGIFSGCGAKKKITIYTVAEQRCMDLVQTMLEEQFPEYDIQQTYIGTGNLEAKLAAEGTKTDADIVLELESAYMTGFPELFATLDTLNYDIYTPDIVPENRKYAPTMRMSDAVVIDPAALQEKNIPIPTSYEDLLKPEYKGLISMPNPKSSDTAYLFLLNLVNAWGEDAAFEYFDKLADNLNGQGFTTSGSGPIQALVTREAAIAFGMTFQAVQAINEGNPFQILFFSEGAPYTTYGNAIIEGKQKDQDVMKVFEYICSVIDPQKNERYAPEPLYNGKEITVENFPKNIPYGDMTGIDDITVKERLLDKWNH